MALLCFNSLLPSSSSRLLSPPPPFTPSPVPRLQIVENQTKSWNGACLRFPSSFTRGRIASSVVVQAAADVDGIGSEGAAEDEKAVPVDKLPLESKEQEKMEQKMKMKLAKKIRLRRKRLVRKRHLRKKGRWPPSKMNKLKNV